MLAPILFYVLNMIINMVTYEENSVDKRVMAFVSIELHEVVSEVYITVVGYTASIKQIIPRLLYATLQS